MPTKESIKKIYHEHFMQNPEVIAQAPGRINIIGEHTDYNAGYVLPAAINQHTIVALSKREDDLVSLYSVLFDEYLEIKTTALHPQNTAWANYILGVVDQLLKRGDKLSGFNLVLDGNVPLGAGLSSSASVECATIVALQELFNLNISKMEIAQLAQQAEHTYPGVKCGIMDQFASVFGKKDHAVRLDCHDLTYQYYPLELGSYGLLLLNTNVEHSLASSAYNDRREACEKAVRVIQKKYTEVQSLRDVSLEMLTELIEKQYPAIYPKAHYVVCEIKRVEEASSALKAGDLKTVGRLMFETHKGLSQDYKVSCDELDFLVDYVKDIPEVLGARVMGGGFGGCTLNLVKKNFEEQLITDLKPIYKKRFDQELTTVEVKPSQGAHLL